MGYFWPAWYLQMRRPDCSMPSNSENKPSQMTDVYLECALSSWVQQSHVCLWEFQRCLLLYRYSKLMFLKDRRMLMHSLRKEQEGQVSPGLSLSLVLNNAGLQLRITHSWLTLTQKSIAYWHSTAARMTFLDAVDASVTCIFIYGLVV